MRRRTGRQALPSKSFLLASFLLSSLLLVSVGSWTPKTAAASGLQVADSSTSLGYDNATNQPVNRTSVFLTTDSAVYSWIEFANVPSNSWNVTWVWLTPQDFLYWRTSATIPSGGHSLWYWNPWVISIRGSWEAQIQGTWHVDIYTNGVLDAIQNFTISQPPEQNLWTNIGPKGISALGWPAYYGSGKVGTLAYDPLSPSTLYIATGQFGIWSYGSGVFKSTDGGNTWSSANNGFTGWEAAQLAVKRGDPNAVVALTPFAIFKSTDGGGTWKATYDGGSFYGRSLYQTSDNTLYVSTGSAIIKSADFGSSWTTLSSFSLGAGQWIMALTVTNGGSTIYAFVYLGLQSFKVMKSTDGGSTYTSSNALSPYPGYGREVEIVPDPGNPSNVWLVAFDWYTSSSLWVSHDGGSTFSQVDMYGLGLSYSISWVATQQMAYDPLNSNTIYLAGDGWLYKSTNDGSSFFPLSGPAPDTRVLVVDPVQEGVVYLGMDQGLYRSSDGGGTWTALNSARSNNFVWSVGVSGQRIFAVVQDYQDAYSCNSGSTWTNAISSACVMFPWNAYLAEDGAVAVNPYLESNVIIYATSCCGSTSTGQVLVSTDGGSSFTESSLLTTLSNAPPTNAHWIVFDSASPNIVYLAGGEGIYESSDYGVSWVLLSGSPSNAVIASSPQNPNVLYASNSQGLYKSSDAGASWALVNSLSSLGKKFSSIAVDPLNAANVVGISPYYNSIFFSTDGGVNFNTLYVFPTRIGYFGTLEVYYFQVSGRSAIVLTGETGILASYDQGSHWVDYTSNLPRPKPEVSSFFLSSTGTAYISTEGTGVWTYNNFFSSPPANSMAALTLSYTVQGGGSGYSAPLLTYTLDGKQSIASLTATPELYRVDSGSQWSISPDLPGSTSTERWSAGQATNGVASGSLTAAFMFYHQFSITPAFSVSGGGSGYGIPAVSCLEYGSQMNVLLGSPAWVDANSVCSYSSVLPGSTSTERWAPATTTVPISGPGSTILTYFHQYLYTLGYSVVGGGSPAAPMLSSTQFGASYSATLATTAAGYWLDNGVSWSLTNPLSGSGPSERWLTPSTVSGTVNSASAFSPAYYHQYFDPLEYVVVGGGSPAAPQVRFVQFGSSTSATASLDASTTEWIDAGTPITYPVKLISSTSTERWRTPAPIPSNATAKISTTYFAPYYHQFLETLSYAIIGGGTPVAPTFTADQFGSVAPQVLTSSPTGYWFDSGSAWTITNALGASTSERWEAANSNGMLSSSAPQTQLLSFYHQYSLTISYAANGRGAPAAPTMDNTQLGQASASTLSTTPTTYWLDSGSSWKLPALLSPSTTSERWISNGTLGSTVTSSSTAVVLYQLQYYVTVAVATTGGGTASPSSSWYNDASSLNLVASPSSGWALGMWAGTGPSSYSGNATSRLVAVGGAINETAIFYPGLTITDGGNGQISYQWGATQGSLSSGTTTVFVPVGTTVSLAASPSLLYAFNGYTGATNSGNAASVLMNGPAAVTASFGLNTSLIAGVVVGIGGAVGVAVFYNIRRHRSGGSSSSSGDWKKGLNNRETLDS